MRVPLCVAGVALVVVAGPLEADWLSWGGLVVLVVGMALYLRVGTVRRDPADGSRPGFGWWPPARRPQAFPGFGQPVLAPAAGRVVRAHGWERDHWSRNSIPGMVYLIVESVRELLGPDRVLGNHVVLDLGDGVYAVLAHLQRRSLLVRTGDRVRTGQHVGNCGSSGNTTEPHVHVQLMDHPHVLVAAGLPMRFTDLGATEQPGAGLPGYPRTP